ncbi:MAG: hypothetical protein K6357_00695 [Elusimicrobiota bacterium]
MKTILIILLFHSYGFSNETLDINETELKKIETGKPQAQIELSQTQPSKFLTYTTDEEFSFESEAKKECNDRVSLFKNYGISTIGCNIFEKNGNYTFTIEYLPELKNPDAINSILIKEYLPQKLYWNENLAKKELSNSLSKFKNSPLKTIDSKIIEVENNYSFKITYIAGNILKKSKTYYAIFGRFKYGKYTFESEAKKNIPIVLNLLKQDGVASVRGKVIENENDYAIEVEYLNKSDNIEFVKENPQYSVETYKSSEIFPFEDNALKEGIKRNELFTKAGLYPIHNYAYEIDDDWSFSTDYVVKNIYRWGNFVGKEHLIKRYHSMQTFDFENEAKKAMEEKSDAFNSAGLYVISSVVYEIESGYSFYIDYIEKQNYNREKN